MPDFVINPFVDMFNYMVELFGVLYATGFMLFDFFTTPIGEYLPGSDIVDPSVFGDLFYQTPFEMMFGIAIIGVLAMAFIKFFTNVI